MKPPVITLGCVANLFARMMHFVDAEDIEHGHTHNFDHLTLLAKGKLRVTVDGKATDFTAPQMIYIKADKNHELVALEADTLAYCIHALRTPDGADILDPSMIPDGVNPTTLAQAICENNLVRKATP